MASSHFPMIWETSSSRCACKGVHSVHVWVHSVHVWVHILWLCVRVCVIHVHMRVCVVYEGMCGVYIRVWCVMCV